MDTLDLLNARLIVFTIISFIFTFVSIFWILVLLESRKELYDDPKPKRRPSLSVIVPAYNEGDVIADCLNSLLKLDYPNLAQIIVVDDGSTDDTKEVAARFLSNPKVKLISKENGGKASAMNEGIKYVKEELVACLDADSIILNPDVLDHMVGYFEDSKIAAVTPALKVYQPANTLQQIQWIEYLLSQFLRKMSAMIDVILVAPGPFTVYRTSVLREIGGFDSSTLTEDMEIAYRLHKYGYSIENSSNAEIGTYAPFTLKDLFLQRLRWARGTYQNMHKYLHFVLNREYGTVGVVMLPLSILTLLLLPLLIPYTSYIFFSGVYQRVESLYYFLSAGIRPELSIDLLASFLGTNFFATFLVVLMFAIALALLFASHKYSGEKVNAGVKAAYLLYMFVFYFVLHIIFLTAFIYEALGVKRKW